MKNIPTGPTGICLTVLLLLSGCGSRNNSTPGEKVATTPSDSSLSQIHTPTLLKDSVCVPVFAIWTEKSTNSKYDGLYDSVTRAFKYCAANKTISVDNKDVTIDPLNRCTGTGGIHALMCVVTHENITEFCRLGGFDSVSEKALFITDNNDSIFASTRRLAPVDRTHLVYEISKEKNDPAAAEKMKPVFYKVNPTNDKFIIRRNMAK
jgi:hypothetical protein